MQKTMNFIAGEFVPAADGTRFSVLSPLTGEPQTEVPNSDVLDVVKAIQAANLALSTWLKTTPEIRADVLTQIASQLERRETEIAEIESQETAVAIAAVIESHKRARSSLLYNAQLVREASPLSRREGEMLERRSPVGLVGVVTSWSEALFQLASRAGAALAAGNCVIAKPSSRASQTAMLFAEAVHAALREVSGSSPGVFGLVQGRGVQVGRTLVAHPGIGTISFSGKTETGRDLQVHAAEFLKRTQLSLSACNPILVFAGIDLEKTAQTVVRLSLTSETPLAFRGARLLVQESIYREFLQVLEAQVRALVIGDPRRTEVRLGPLISKSARDAFRAAVTKAQLEKGKLLFGGINSPEGLPEQLTGGNYVLPTLIFDLTGCSTLQQEEVNGPLLLCNSFKYQNDALKAANNSPFAQVSYLFHSDSEKAPRLAQQLESGRVFINPTHLSWDPRAPYSAGKGSGLGYEGGVEGLRFFTRPSLLI